MSVERHKTFLSLHTWTGLAAGMALFIAFYAGAITVFFHELEAWDNYPENLQVQQDNLQQAQSLVDGVLAHTPAAGEQLRLYLAGEHGPRNSVYWYERHADGTFTGHEFRLDETQALDTSKNTAQVGGFIYRLHYTAGLPTTFGLYVLGFICVLYGLALVSGVVIFAKNFLSDLFIVRQGRNLKRFWLDAHNVVGVLSLPWHIMFAWSSAVLAIGTIMLAPFQFLVFEDDLLETVSADLGIVAQTEPSGETGALLSVSKIVDIARAEVPGMQPTQLRYANAGDTQGTVTVFAESAGQTLSRNTTVILNPVSGQVLSVRQPADTTVGDTFYSGLITLHYVAFGGYLTKFVFFLLSLAGAFLFYSGNLLWIESRRRRRSVEQRGNVTFLARLNSGVCIGCMAGISAAMLASRVFIESEIRPEIMEWSYFAVFFAAVAWMFARPVAAGTRDLLIVCAVTTCAIPVSSALLTSLPIWTALADGQWAVFGVEAMALAFAIGFWQMAMRVQQRARDGAKNSVWAETEKSPTPLSGEQMGTASSTP